MPDASISGWAALLNVRGGAELRRGGEVDGVSYALLSDSKAGGGYGGASRRSSRGNPRESELLKARRVVCSKSRAITAQT